MIIRDYIFIFFLSFLPYVVGAQIHVLSGTKISIDSATTLSFNNSAGTIIIDSSTTFINNGVIILGSNTSIDEQAGFPVVGTGYEKYDTVFIGYINNLNAGGIGIKVSGNLNGLTEISRYHQSITDSAGGYSVKRYFKMNNNVLFDTVWLYCDTTELNGYLRSNLTVLGNTINGYKTYSGDYSMVPYRQGVITNSENFWLTLSSNELLTDSLNRNLFCENDTLTLYFTKSGFDNGGPYILQLSDVNGSFTNFTNIDTAYLYNGELNYLISAPIINSSNYHLRVYNNSINIFSDTLLQASIYNLPPVPVISASFDSLSCNETGFTYNWYYNGNLLNGDTTQTIFVNQNGSYVVEITNQGGCRSISDTLLYQSAGISALDNISINVNPNPVTDVINISSKTDFSFRLFDLNGRLLMTSCDNRKNHSLVVSQLSSGYYIGEIRFSNNTNSTVPIIIQH